MSLTKLTAEFLVNRVEKRGLSDMMSLFASLTDVNCIQQIYEKALARYAHLIDIPKLNAEDRLDLMDLQAIAAQDFFRKIILLRMNEAGVKYPDSTEINKIPLSTMKYKLFDGSAILLAQFRFVSI